VTLAGIPPKSNFKFHELATITGVKPYVLRFWETEFPEINPVIDESGEKRYSRSDVESILRIKALLFERKMSIAEAQLSLRSSEQLEGLADVSDENAMASLQEALGILRDVRRAHHW
jgi:DNA-binding transcriptional MerR regulator